MLVSLKNGAAVALTILLSVPAAHAQQTAPMEQAEKPAKSVAELEASARQAYQDKDWVRFYADNMKLHKQRPHAPDYVLNIVLATSSLDRKRTAYHYMLKMQQQGLSYDFNEYEESANIRGTEAYEYMNDLMIKAGNPSGEGATVYELDFHPSHLGDIAWDESRKRLLVGTRDDGRLLAVDDAGTAELLLRANEENGLWSIDGIAVDAEKGRLWIASSASPDFAGFEPADLNRGALFGFDLETLEAVERYDIPADRLRHSLGSVAITDSGDVYVIDRATPIIYRKPESGDRLKTFAGGPQLVALTDIAVAPDNSRLFVSDAVMGVLLIDPLRQRSAMLSGPETLNLFGIYGIEFIDGKLIITQSGISPQRILRLELNPDGATVANVAPMASALEGFDTPGVGTTRGENLYYFANHGTASADAKARLMATPLEAGNDVKPPDMQQFEEALRQATQKANEQ